MVAIIPQTNLRRATALLHAAYFMLGGLWAVTGRRTFEAVTGPKIDYWLVRTVGGLLSVIGLVLASATLRDRITTEVRWLAIGSSGVLATISAFYAAKGRIRSIYALDTLANLVLIASWFVRERNANSELATRGNR